MVDKNRTSFLLSFVDMLFAMLLCVSSLFILNFLLITVKNENQKKVDSKAEILITMTWDDHSANDIDLWVLTPEKTKIGFPNKQNTYMGLERDDLGLSNDTTYAATTAIEPDVYPDPQDQQVVVSEDQLIYKNIETVAIRAKHPGRYVVNVMWYSTKPHPVTNKTKNENEQTEVQLMQLNPVVNIAAVAKPVLLSAQTEATAFSFDVLPDGSIANVSYEQQPFIANPQVHGASTDD